MNEYYLGKGVCNSMRFGLGDDTERRVPTLGFVNTCSVRLRHLSNPRKLILSGRAFHVIEQFLMFVGRWYTRRYYVSRRCLY